VDLKDIKAIIDLMKKNSISEFELERQDFKIRLKRGPMGGSQSFEEGGPGGYSIPGALSFRAPCRRRSCLCPLRSQPRLDRPPGPSWRSRRQ
jgi:hypothetical protein